MKANTIIQLSKDVRIRSMPRNYVLERKVIIQEGEKKGEEGWDLVGYYSTLYYLINGLFDKNLKLKINKQEKLDITTLTDLINTTREETKKYKKQIIKAVENGYSNQNLNEEE